MINVVIPMAGLGSRFAVAGYTKPKPFVDVGGKPMIVRVLENLACEGARYFLIARREHLESEKGLVRDIEREFSAQFIPVEKVTEGTACTALYARQYINNHVPLLIANSDQIVDIDIEDFISVSVQNELDGAILTFEDESRNPKWSFARLNQKGLVVEVQEKRAISKHATVGIYFYNKGHDFVDAAIDMIVERNSVNGEYYTCPTYNYLIRNGKKIGIRNIQVSEMHGIGTPEDLEAYLKISTP